MNTIKEFYKKESNRYIILYASILFVIASCFLPFYTLLDNGTLYHVSYLSMDGFLMFVLMGVLLLGLLLKKTTLQCIVQVLAVILYIYDCILVRQYVTSGYVEYGAGMIFVCIGLLTISIFMIPTYKGLVKKHD